MKKTTFSENGVRRDGLGHCGRLLLATFLYLLPSCVGAASTASADEPGGYRVSDNGRYLLAGNGQPFFWLGDTAWTLCDVLNREDAAHYLDVRAKQGFTVIQLPAVMSRYVGRPNAYGDKAFVDDNLARPAVTPGNSPDDPAQYDYWDHVEYVIDAAADRGLTIGMLPFFVAFGPGWDYLSPGNADDYGRFIGKRFGHKSNIVWILGGDDPADTDAKRAVWDAMAKGITEAAVGSEDYSKTLMTYHTRGGTSSSYWLHDKPWLDFNMIQTWSAFTSIHDRVTHDYRLTPVKPTGLGEGAYENGPEYPTKPITAHVIRKQAYWSYLSGGYHTYGNTSIWNFGIESYYSKKPWQEALTDPGAVHVSVAANLFKSLPWWGLVPDRSVFAGGTGAGGGLNVAARADDGSCVVIYLADAGTVSIRMDQLAASPVQATWVDPQTGARSAAGTYPNTGEQSFSPPDGWEDAVLLLHSHRTDHP